MKKLLYPIFFLAFCQANSQYYYKDIVGANDVIRQMKTYSANGVRKITGVGITPTGGPSSDFNEIYEINGTSLKITTTINNTVSSLRHNFNEKGLIITTVDSAAGVRSVSTYTYDANNKITSISNVATDADSSGDFSQTEVHQYVYKNDKLEKMLRIINKNDSLELRFVVDDNGNVIEERNYRRGVFTDPIYYYYDGRNRLTDIVRFNYKANRLLPDYLFEYDDSDRVIQKITTTSGQNLGYLTWRYVFDQRGLKTKEALFNKEKQLQGRIDYSYN
jgi:antitoxin component YwqK of YwqJK toxin-antitoxin module